MKCQSEECDEVSKRAVPMQPRKLRIKSLHVRNVVLVCVRAPRLLQLESSCQNSVMRVRRSRQVELLHHILARSRAKPEEVQGL